MTPLLPTDMNTLAKLKAFVSASPQTVMFLLDWDTARRNAEDLRAICAMCGFDTVIAFCEAGQGKDICAALTEDERQSFTVIELPCWHGGWLRKRDIAAVRSACPNPDFIGQTLDYDLTGFSADYDRPRNGRIRKTLLELSAVRLLGGKAAWLMINREYKVVRIARGGDILNRTFVRPFRLAAYWVILRLFLVGAWFVARPVPSGWRPAPGSDRR